MNDESGPRIDSVVESLRRQLEATQQRLEEAEGQLRGVDAALARRPALADLPTRVEKIAAACQAAQAGCDLMADRDNAVRQCKEACPDYPWQAATESPMSEAAWAVCSSLKGTKDAIQDWAQLTSRLRAEIEADLALIPADCRVRVAEGGGPEDPVKSLAVSIAKLAVSRQELLARKAGA